MSRIDERDESRDEARLRLEELTEIFYHRPGAELASSMIARSGLPGGPNLSRLLRHASAPPGYIGDKETRQRDAFDYLLEYYSILEIAASLQSLPDPLPPKLREQAVLELGNRAVLLYYAEHYPLELPRLFLKRVTTGSGARVEFNENREEQSQAFAYYLFSEFIGLATWMSNDDDIETFQWFLDDGVRGGLDIDDTLDAIRDRDQFAKCLSVEESERDPLDQSIIGFQKFVDFCIQFDQLLKSAQAFPVLEQQMRDFFSYWFVELKEKVGREVRRAISLFASWDPLKDVDQDAARREVAEYINTANSAIANLIGEQNDEPERRAMVM